ncbi:PAAR domain-containing protein [Variovorax robiniae]|uniref:PAAR domain-containing protein n=2 Tax=Variovorax TaxID=34072 RepID=A0ABU8XJU0_9BURK|nr:MULTISPECIES: PAAR domain-containing protein [unclassified Variovorax]
MDRPFILLGDKTNHGGVVITASENTFTDEKRVARIGDLVKCPIPGHGINPIVTASPYVEIDGRRVARHHDTTACGSLLLASQFDSSSE